MKNVFCFVSVGIPLLTFVHAATPPEDPSIAKFQKEASAIISKHPDLGVIRSEPERTDMVRSLAASSAFKILGNADINANSEPWEMFAFALRQQISGGSDMPGLQIVTVPVAADWGDDTPQGFYRRNRVLGDSIPVWGPTYTPTEKQITKGYEAFITNIAIPIPDAAEAAKAEKARGVYLAAVQALQAKLIDCGQQWKSFNAAQSSIPENRQLKYDAWYAQFGGRTVAAAQSSVSLAGQTYSSYLNKAYKGYAFIADLIPSFNNPAFQLQGADENGMYLPYRTFNISPTLETFIANSKGLPPAANPKISFELTKNSSRLHTEDTSWGGHGSLWGGFFGRASAGGSSHSIDTHDEHFSMAFSAKNFQVFTIQPGQWFNGTAIEAFKNGPWLSDGPIAKGDLQLWGENGVLNLMPVQLIVAFRPKVVARVSSADYHQLKTAIGGGGGFSFGPFSFGANYNKQTTDIRTDDASNTITAEDSGDVPQVIAVISRRLPDFK